MRNSFLAERTRFHRHVEKKKEKLFLFFFLGERANLNKQMKMSRHIPFSFLQARTHLSKQRTKKINAQKKNKTNKQQQKKTKNNSTKQNKAARTKR